MARRTGILIQARSTSQRLPGKIFADIPFASTRQSRERDRIYVDGERIALLDHVYGRLSAVKGAELVIFLVPASDLRLVNWCIQRGYEFVTGPEEDVRERYRQAANCYGLDIIVRATGDNPCVDPLIAEQTIEAIQRTNCDLFSYSNLPLGIAVEAFTRKALCSDQIPAKHHHREHVSLHIKENRRHFRVEHRDHSIWHSWPEIDQGNLPRLTVDTAEDLEVVRHIFAQLDENFTLNEILDLYQRQPQLFDANRHVEQLTFSA